MECALKRRSCGAVFAGKYPFVVRPIDFRRAASFGERMVGAARLERATYEAVEQDRTATGQALGVVVLSSVATGLGLGAGLRGLIINTLVSIVLWAIWAALVYAVGTRLLPEPDTRADWGEVARTVGFAQTPGVLRLFGIIPGLGEFIRAAADIWVLIATVVAVRQALDYRSLPRAVGVCLIGWVLQIVVFAIVRRALV